MSQAQAATGPDRLPWLEDEPPPPRRRRRVDREGVGWVVAAALLAFACAYWIGMQTSEPSAHTPTTAQSNAAVGPLAANLAEPQSGKESVQR